MQVALRRTNRQGACVAVEHAESGGAATTFMPDVMLVDPDAKSPAI